ncbi:hypothetical protein NC651_021618 [Populus alba x Populus x berolinensis]|nr:hypothetical protein NC651_021618 [Populus alba x Populus x berolinensis]
MRIQAINRMNEFHHKGQPASNIKSSLETMA